MGLDSGADDYIIKPFSPKELESRIRSVLRRFNSNNSTSSKKNKIVLKTNNLVINLNTRQVSKNGLVIKLTNIECNILELLINNHGKKLSRSMILNNVWGYIPQRIVDTRIVDVHIARLRSKIEEDAANPDLIITERGVGYVFLSLDR
jgi:OmpR family response regulator RpaB